MRQIWTDMGHCTLDGVPFEYATSDYEQIKTTDKKVWVLKPQSFFEMYDRFLAGRTPERVLLEVGVFQGGSGLLFADKWPGARISGLDLQPRNDAVQRHAVRFGFSDRLKFYYGVSQADERAVLRIIDQDLDGSPDVVIDDASHLYPLTKRTFEIVFPRLARGGVYIIEDWAWAHWDGYQTPEHPWWHHLALSNLVFELTMVAGCAPHLIEEIYIARPFVAVRKSCGVMTESFRLEDHYISRGKELNKI